MRWFGRLAGHFSLRVRLTVLAALGAALVLPIAALLLHGGLSAALDEALSTELRIRADDVAAELSAGLPPVIGPPLLTQILAGDGTVVSPAGAAPLLGPGEVADAAGAEIVVERDVPGIGGPGRILARPVEASDGTAAIVAVAGSTAPIARARHRLAVVLGVVGPMLVLVLAATAWMLASAALRPVRRMTRRAETISLEEPRARLPQPPGKDEIAELGRTLNHMLDRIEATIAHERAFVDDASHELRSPLAVLRGELELLRLDMVEEGEASGRLRAIDSAIEETDRLSRVADQMLVLARADAGRLADGLQAVPLLATTQRIVDRLPLGDVEVEVAGDEVDVMADVDLLDHLLANLLSNAGRFARGRICVQLTGAGPHAVLVIADDGPGFAPELLHRALDRFSRGEPSRTRDHGGAGLGLSIVAAVADACDGRVTLSNGGPLGGAVVEVRLPRAA
jgi:signal transduction histidine kinase